MLNSETLSKLRAFKVPGFVQELVQQHEQPQSYNALPFDERLTLLIEAEHARRAAARSARRLRHAALLSHASIDQVDLGTPRGISRAQFLELAQGGWIASGHHVIITGATGVGKTFIGSAIATHACHRGFNVRYQRAHEWCAEFAFARNDGSLKKLRTRLAKLQLLIIDEWLREPLPAAQARDLLDLFDDRYRKASCMLISQVPVSDWHALIQDPTLADALLDRIVHDSIRLHITGESMRKLTSKLEQGGRVASLRGS